MLCWNRNLEWQDHYHQRKEKSHHGSSACIIEMNIRARQEETMKRDPNREEWSASSSGTKLCWSDLKVSTTGTITNTPERFCQHFQVIFSKVIFTACTASFVSDSFFPVQSILFIDLISGTIPPKSSWFPSVLSSPSCFRAGQMEN